MWKPQKPEPRAEVGKICQPLAKPDTWLRAEACTLRVEKLNMEDKERFTSQKIPQESLSKCNNAVNAGTPFDWNIMSGVHLVGEKWEGSPGMGLTANKSGQKELKRQWDGTGTDQRGQKAGSNPQGVGKWNYQNFHHPTALSWNPRLFKHSHCSALAAVPPSHLPQRDMCSHISCTGITVTRVLRHGHKCDKQMTVGLGWSRLKVFLLSGWHQRKRSKIREDIQIWCWGNLSGLQTFRGYLALGIYPKPPLSSLSK